MITPRLVTIQTANPAQVWTQEEICRTVFDHPRISGRALKFYEKFLRDDGIHTRCFGMESLSTVVNETPDESVLRFQNVASEIGIRAVSKCMEDASLSPEEVDALIVTTCTGYLCPGLTSYISEACGLREDIFTLDLTGLGCGAALPALRAGVQYLKSGSGLRVIVACVEVCSAALSWGDEMDLIISNSIFADGAAACLLSSAGEPGYEFLGFESLLWPQYRDDLRFTYRDARLCNVIKKNVPMIAATAVKNLHDNFSMRLQEPFHHYAVHPGGRKILDEVESVLELDKTKLKRSREVLRRYGNMSSPSILYVLKAMIENDLPREDENILAFAFGAGFTAFGAVLRACPVGREDLFLSAEKLTAQDNGNGYHASR